MESMDLTIHRLPDSNFWKGKKVLVTGHTGFKGSWLVIWLHSMGAIVSGLSLQARGLNNLFDQAAVEGLCTNYYTDIRHIRDLQGVIKTTKPEVIFHLAAQPLVIEGYENPLETFEINVMGTANVLEAAKFCDSTTLVIVVTTDKVYAGSGQRALMKEGDRLAATDPYSASKACAELITDSFRYTNSVADLTVATVRAGNVIGGGDWAENRLVPDAIRSWMSDSPLIIRNPHSIRPWQHVLEPLNGYMCLAELLLSAPDLAGAFNFGPFPGDELSVTDVLSVLSKELAHDFYIDQPHTSLYKENDWLGLDVEKASATVGYNARWTAETAIKMTAQWYLQYADRRSALSLCHEDIHAYSKERV